jgi:hypothetical protein
MTVFARKGKLFFIFGRAAFLANKVQYGTRVAWPKMRSFSHAKSLSF